jgi:hypothetical protein
MPLTCPVTLTLKPFFSLLMSPCILNEPSLFFIKPNNQTPNKKDGSVVIYKVGTDNIITEATNSLSARLKQTYGEDNVVVTLTL